MSLGLVPTMGNLHAGHLALVERSIRENKKTIVSVYVNPLQFGPNEDFDQYPRTLDADRAILSQYDTVTLWAPTTKDLYPLGVANAYGITAPKAMAQHWCGNSRPHFFDGVCTVVFRLCQQANPTRLYMGEKDYQQCTIIQGLIHDYRLPISVVPCPIVREADGLAYSSRNQYLSPAERVHATQLYRAIQAAQTTVTNGEPNPAMVIQTCQACLGSPLKIDYVGIADPCSLKPIDRDIRPNDRLMLAAHLGKTRLVDNHEFHLGTSRAAGTH
ncbi:MAG: pantoate--beta-alanine ligase [Candidatus Marinamargulisbacteria bacterium]|nr:pantoate--beta-alanine ligase [Candidatus Marinamargulisbacteria bacterium]